MRADRWQTGDCGVYATALMEEHPHLRLGAIIDDSCGRQRRSWLHWFAHDDTTAYDSRGAHPLPYRQVWDSAAREFFTEEEAGSMGLECVTDLDPADFGLSPGERELIPLARAHMRRHGTGPGEEGRP